MPRREQPARLVEERGDEPAVGEPRAALVALVVREGRLVLGRAFFGRMLEVKADLVPAAPEARGIVLRGNARGYRRPPCSKWALKKFSDPDVAIADEAEISSESVAAATICAKR